MMKFQYCPYCRSQLQEKEKTYICLNNEHIIYKNSIPAVSTVPIRKNKILLGVRSFDPEKGKLDVIGGFTDPGETPVDTAVRETKEETGLEIEILDLVGIYMSKYFFQGEYLDVMNIYYVVKASGEPSPQDDVAELRWYDINKLPEDEFAFKHLKPGLEDVKKWMKDNPEEIK